MPLRDVSISSVSSRGSRLIIYCHRDMSLHTLMATLLGTPVPMHGSRSVLVYLIKWPCV